MNLVNGKKKKHWRSLQDAAELWRAMAAFQPQLLLLALSPSPAAPQLAHLNPG